MSYFCITVKGDRNHIEKGFEAGYIGRRKRRKN